MKKQTTKLITNLIVNHFINLLNDKFFKKNDLDFTVNSLMSLTFDGQSTEDSIALIEKFKEESKALIERFEAEAHKELTKRKTLAIIEKNAIDWHFKKPNNTDIEIVKVNYELINN